ncbi:peptidoglycan DD-metalloendopeptidase family protein [Pedobacter xixiisoli]|uniref:Peptidase family M23 n=1 Tax=Pedobacter xixiisoli TaxID=1476464 RepID=A0A285ZTC1_9SPHI|nr:peptidoglycan DD-metalloendopeptidase family protein [Pedobacter xixiisoli]SOD12876.1 Peptidase family M23 [Pedobacter xixiisoli]
MKFKVYYSLFLICALQACKSGPFNLLKPASPHQQYERKLVNAGLNQNVMGAQWINKANTLLQNYVSIKLPYKETGYFAADKIEGASFKFSLQRGQLLTVKLNKQSVNSFSIYMDIWEQKDNGELKVLAFADSIGNDLQLEAKNTGDYYLRLQPELLVGGSYTLELNIGPSLGYPLKAVNRKQIQSFFGVGRDNDTRRHEGIDIFSSFRTPVIAVADGTVTRVNENNLGGKVVWFRHNNKDYTLYYAHLDEQTATTGQEVLIGDTLGLMGNTGNAKNTPPHLHFGIYTSEGAVDPLPFVDPLIPPLPSIKSDIAKLNTTLRTVNRAIEISDNQQFINPEKLKQNTIVRVLAASNTFYKVELPNGKSGYIANKSLVETKSLSTRKISSVMQNLLDSPNLAAGVKANLVIGQTVNVMGVFEDFQLVSTTGGEVGWLSLK